MTNPDNHGPGFARQVSIDRAIGDYIIFCDSDDRFLPNELYNYFHVYQRHVDQCEKEPDIIFPTVQILTSAEDTDRWDSVPSTFPDNLHGLCIKRQFLIDHNIRFLNQYFHEDGIFTLACADHNPDIAYFNTATIVHRFRPGSVSFFGDCRLYDVSLLISLE